VFAVGQSYLDDLPVTPGAYDGRCGSDGHCDNSSASLYIPEPDGFIAKYSLDLQTTHALTYIGGSGGDALESVAVDSVGDVLVAGTTSSPDLETTAGAHDRLCGSDGRCDAASDATALPPTDVFVAKLDSGLGALAYASFLGGEAADVPFDLALFGDDTPVVVGSTSSPDFPVTAGAHDTTYAGGSSGNADSDGFVSMIDTSGAGAPDPLPAPGPGSNAPPTADAGEDQVVGSRATVYLDGGGSADADGALVSYRWTQLSGPTRTLRDADQRVASLRAPSVRRGGSATLVFELTVTDDQGASATDRVTITVAR